MRQKLANRRPSEQFSFECNGLKYTATVSRYPDHPPLKFSFPTTNRLRSPT